MKNKQAFTLIELSIVLIIIGLIVGGALVGRDLIESAKLRSVTNDIQKYKTTYQTFRLKYNCYPGDCPNATSFFADPAGSCYSVTGTGLQTCNGNGNRIIETTSHSNGSYGYEPWRFWQHLNFAGLISGVYTGISHTGTCDLAAVCATVGLNIPSNAISNAGWMVTNTNSYSGSPWGGKPGVRNILALVNPDNQQARRWYGASLTPLQMSGIDLKIDDGMPASGSITEMSGSSSHFTPDCTTSNNITDTSAVYQVNIEQVECVLLADLD